MKKHITFGIISILIISLGVLPSKGFSYLEEKTYCQISKEKIAISLKSEDGQACTYLSQQIEIAMKKTYMDILLIQSYIDQKQDIEYWTPIKDKRIERLKKLQEVRLNIITHIKTFEQNLLGKSKTYFLQSIASYETKLRYTLKAVEWLRDSDSKLKYISLINQQLNIIDLISQSQTFESLSSYTQQYVYLKAKIEWK